MCGIFGFIGNGFNNSTIRSLAIANESRGKDSLGFFNSRGEIHKNTGRPVVVLGQRTTNRYLKDSHVNRVWFLAGHTRAATHGNVTIPNAHPYTYGRIIGCHNGVVYAPNQYEVDSQYIFDQLHRHTTVQSSDNADVPDTISVDYQTALADISGYWAIAFTDGQSFYLHAAQNSVAIGKVKNGWYYSSDPAHIKAACAVKDIQTISGGDCWRWYRNEAGNIACEVMPRLVMPDRTQNDMYDLFRERTQGGGMKRKDCYYGLTDREMREADSIAEQLGFSDFYDYCDNRCIDDEFDGYDAIIIEGEQIGFDAIDE